jgi:hypothetical protein
MAAPTPHTWPCPSCGRRVPLRAEVCHCGMTRARAEELLLAQPEAARAPRVSRSASDGRELLDAMTGDVKLLLAIGALVMVAGLGWLVFGPRQQPYPAVLGYVDAGPPKPPPPVGFRQPPFKLPWWK